MEENTKQIKNYINTLYTITGLQNFSIKPFLSVPNNGRHAWWGFFATTFLRGKFPP